MTIHLFSRYGAARACLFAAAFATAGCHASAPASYAGLQARLARADLHDPKNFMPVYCADRAAEAAARAATMDAIADWSVGIGLTGAVVFTTAAAGTEDGPARDAAMAAGFSTALASAVAFLMAKVTDDELENEADAAARAALQGANGDKRGCLGEAPPPAPTAIAGAEPAKPPAPPKPEAPPPKRSPAP